MIILVDAMGGDNAPDAVIKGAVKAIEEVESEVVLIGNEEIINKIKEEYENYKNIVTQTLSDEERDELGAFYTPPELSVKMLKKFGPLGVMIDDDWLDPTVGAGGLLAAAIISGMANPKHCYGIELNEKMAEVCRNRLEKLGVPRTNIITGSALDNSKKGPYAKLKELGVKGIKLGGGIKL